ncbi:MAG: VOC family protein [Rhodomicrobium sp.]
MLQLDHIVVASLTLEEGVAHVERCLGAIVPPGGEHPSMGTHNHVMRLGDRIYLEIISPNPKVHPKRPRWFGLDRGELLAQLKLAPRLMTWVVRAPDLRVALQTIPEAGEVVRASRGDLSWLISVPADGAMPFDGAFPTLIQWPDRPHPSERMVDLGCRLRRLEVAHPDANLIGERLSSDFEDRRVTLVEENQMRLRAEIMTPAGFRELI